MIGELELAWRVLPNRFVGITGTNGKTTVAELLGHVWRTAGEPVAVAGNVGTPLSSLVGELDPETTVVCEASSFQLEDADAFAPDFGVSQPRPQTITRALHSTILLPVREAPVSSPRQGNGRRLHLQRLRPGAARRRALGGCGHQATFCAAREVTAKASRR